MSFYDHYLTKPNHKDASYYIELLEYWLPTDENFNIDLSKCSQPGDFIDKNNEDKLLWYYNTETNQLFIPTKNAAKILIYKYHNDPSTTPVQSFCPTDTLARSWLRCLGFCGAFVNAGSKSVYAGVTGDKVPAKVQHCYMFDLSITEEQRENNRPTESEIEDMQTQYSPMYASPANWLARRVAGADFSVAGHYPAKPPQLLTSKQQFARQQQIKRLRIQFGEHTDEFKQALALYDRGIRRTPTTKAGVYDRKQLAKRTHTRLIELVQTIGGVHYDESRALDPSFVSSETLTKNEFYSQRGFGALAQTFNATSRRCLPGTKYPIAFVWDARRVHVTGYETPLLEIISIAVAEAWLKHPDHLPNYNKAESYAGVRDIPLAMQDRYGFHKIVVFTNPEYKAARTQRATRKHRRKDQRMAEMEAQIARLTQLLENQNA